jgi:hypothetical protein
MPDIVPHEQTENAAEQRVGIKKERRTSKLMLF